MNRKNLAMIVLILFISSISAISIRNYYFKDSDDQSSLIDFSEITAKISDTNNWDNIVVFTNSQSQYDWIKTHFQIIKEYPTLRALEVASGYVEKLILSKLVKRMFPSSDYKQSIQLDPVIKQEINAGLQLNSVNDADLLKVSDLWALGYNGTGIKVAVFDNGVNFNHEGLQGQNYTDPVLFNNIAGTSADPCYNHGTPVAGLIAAVGSSGYENYVGTGFGAKLLSMEMGCSGQDLIGDPIAGFEWLATQNDTIKVVNLSWGQDNGLYFEPIIDRLSQLGIVVVIAAGNVETPSEQNNKFKVNDPATAIGGIAVGAVDYSQNPTDFSALGPSPTYAYKPDLVAPGNAVITTTNGGGYNAWSGTSFSAPIVSGAIASLISGLDQQNIPWNVGTIKAALMRTATTLPYDELKVGQGLPNLNATWQYLLSTPADSKGPRVLEITPSKGPYPIFKTFPKNVVGSVPISLITSHPNLVDININGNLSQILSFSNNLNSEYSQLVNLVINTTNIIEGTYTGFVNASIGSDFVVSEFTISVSGEAKARVLLDLRHTNWDINRDDVIGGFNIGEMIKIAQNQNIWIHEFNSKITPQILNYYDIVWMPDPFDLIIDEYDAQDPLLDSEINAITDFVADGGSLFIDFLGYFKDKNSPLTFGVNSTEINRLISNFGITTSSNTVIYDKDNLVYETATLNNVSSLVGNVTKLTHYGNYLNIDDSAHVIASTTGGDIVGTYQNLLGGKVLVSDTNFWLDNVGATGNYINNGGTNDMIFSHNTWTWLTSDVYPEITPQQLNNTGYEINQDLIFTFDIYDFPAPIAVNNILMFLDGNQILSSSYSIDGHIISVTVGKELLQKSGHWYNLQLSITDNGGYNQSLIHSFYVGEEPVTSNTILPSTTIASTTTNTSSSIITTISSRSSTKDTKKASDGFLTNPTWELILISVFSLYLIRRRYLRHN